jgi:predicted dienelactone hydrolase
MPGPPPVPPFAVGWRRLTLVDRSRTVPGAHTDNGRPGPRVLATDLWYAAAGRRHPTARPGAVPETAAGPFPLIVFAPGFDASPSTYAPLLTAWARAGYVVASPSFPLTNPDAVGGLDEYDIANQPRDVSFIITRLLRLARAPHGPFAGLIDPRRVGVAGHSDGADTALVAADGDCCRDPRIRALIVMAGAALPFFGTYLSKPGPPIMVMQGSADAFNPPAYAQHLYAIASPPKYLLWMPGADHATPFVGTGPADRAVRAVSLAFLGRYLAGRRGVAIRVPAPERAVAVLWGRSGG